MTDIPSIYLPPVTVAREAVEARLRTLTQVAGAWEVTYRDSLADILVPQADIELALVGTGTTDVQQNLTSLDEETWAFMAMVTCSRALANDDVSIRRVVEVTLHAVRNLLLSDITQGVPGVVVSTVVNDYEIADALDRGYYSGTLAFHLTIWNSRPELF
ncbi:MAG: hypothetical protein QM754_18550 [Tepidisphaeraceae bacterium]